MMESLERLMADLQAVAKLQNKNFDFNKYQLVKLEQQQYRFKSSDDVVHFLMNLGDIEGWVQETSFIHHLHHETYRERSIPLNGELSNKSYSFTMDYIGKGVWHVEQYSLRYTEIPSEATHLAERLEHCEVDSNNRLIYQRLWHFKGDVPVADIAIFERFEG